MNADLHCHSIVSDGLLTPAAVVQRAADNGVELLALTDHDEVGGIAAARAEAARLGVGFVAGVEVSVSFQGETVHVVGLGIDDTQPQLLAGLAQVRSGRDARAVRIAAELDRAGIHGALEGARALAANPALVSRSHFARFIVSTGLMRNVAEVFRHYLAKGKPGYVPHTWATLAEAVDWIHAAGGLAVVAHPARYRYSGEQFEQLFDEFQALGGEAVEVVSGSHDEDDVRHYATVARRRGLLASRASDFHGPLESPVDLGHCVPLPPDLVPVWTRLTPS